MHGSMNVKGKDSFFNKHFGRVNNVFYLIRKVS
jgi:hypothetical protein